MRQLALLTRGLEPVRLKLAAIRAGSRSASCRLSTLRIDACCLDVEHVVNALGAGDVREGVVEGVDRTPGRDLEAKAGTRCHVADGKLYSVSLGVPKEKYFIGPAQSLR
jgi:hypothetical protein